MTEAGRSRRPHSRLAVGAGCWLGFSVSSQFDFTPSNRLDRAFSQHGGWSPESKTVRVRVILPSKSGL